MTGGRFLAETLHGYGIDHVFFMPVIVQRAMVEMDKLGIRHIMTHGEKAAAYMADGYARAAQRPGICLAQSVGAANLAAGLQDPYLGLSPVIALTGRRPRMGQYRNAYQEIDHMPPFSAVTKFSAAVDSAGQFPFLLRQAIREAMSGAPGPAHLDLEGTSGNVVADGEADMEVIIEEQFARIPPYRPEPDREMVLAAARTISEAQRPVIVAGGGVTLSGAQQQVVQLAEMLSIPVATSLNAKGTIPDEHPLSVGVCGSYSRVCANRIVSEADLVIYIGSHTGSQVTNEWTVPALGTAVVQIDIDPSEMGRTYPAKVTLQGDARASLVRLMEALEPSTSRDEWASRARQLVGEWRQEVAPVVESDAVPIRPERLCKALTDNLPSDAVLVSDTGHSGIWSGTMVDLNHPAQSYLRCAGSLGWGFPAALGVKCALPDRPVLCFTGDGGFWYHMSELETAARYGINAVIVVNNNHSLNQEKRSNERVYAGEPGSEALWHMLDVDFSKIAEAIGCFGIRVEQPGQIQSALEQAFASGRPAVVDVVTDIEGIAPPAWRPDA
ncbi:MAG: thiamine pyrophosphate-binding protein [Chloroflexi bacterium]|nr:thiamine pyrophosphate-binding protein [Chloroflexota bacterium]MCI0785933.1 thiamine pyrophosphate-binding protein [Chloroflexota bacterium]MCI0794097.1 thiamine pyrophosphate-binding protein [Chloroflexota bacterium]MCI0798349.1 thiamine pyrophosphate-binding protein [Chloroflexota bacterium]MCI0824812.1 thiamine pyrophosphate-binding protein [Chloroflexota bacterium]